MNINVHFILNDLLLITTDHSAEYIDYAFVALPVNSLRPSGAYVRR